MHARLLPFLLMVLIALSFGVVRQADAKKRDHCGKTLPFDEINFFFELNDTDQDLGIQLQVGAEPWKRLKITDPTGKVILDVEGKNALKGFGLSTLFFESNEPSFDEMSMEEILALFPEGEYRFTGLTIEGDKLKGTALLTHDLPDAPVIASPEEDEVVDPDDVVVTWLPVTTPAGIEIESYQVIVTNEDDSRFAYDVRVPADATSLAVPAGFFEPDTEYELEILAVEESGNQTISVIFFKTEAE